MRGSKKRTMQLLRGTIGEVCKMNEARKKGARSQICRFFTMRGWPASHFATITAVAGKQQVRPENLTANGLDHLN